MLINDALPVVISPRLTRLREVAALFSPSTPPGNEWAADVTGRAALPQIRVETLIGSQAEFQITN